MEILHHLRIGQDEREPYIQQLISAVGEGRISHEEHEERLTAVQKARILPELDRLVADLPALPGVRRPLRQIWAEWLVNRARAAREARNELRKTQSHGRWWCATVVNI